MLANTFVYTAHACKHMPNLSKDDELKIEEKGEMEKTKKLED